MTPNPRVALVFPGQGTQFVGMGEDVYNASPAARAVFDLSDKVLGFALSRLCFAGPGEELRQTANAQPAIVTVSLALVAAIQQSPWLSSVHLFAGHSLGEYSALAAAGVVSIADAILLVRRRGKLMQQAGDNIPGAMSAVIGLDESSLKIICQETGVFVANYNCPGQIVISGTAAGVKAAGRLALEKGARRVMPLPVSGAFHTPLMAQAAGELAVAIDRIKWANPSLPVITNIAAVPTSSVSAIKADLTAQLTHPVRWQKSIAAAATLGVDTFVEVGPGQYLTGLIKRINPGSRVINIGDVATVNKYSKQGLDS